MLSKDGRTKTFDATANGYARGEGAAAIVITSADLVISDRILALIKGSAMNQDGKSASLTAPSRLAQSSLLRQALNKAGVQPEHVSYVEAHGTGTALGDPIELGAIRDVYLETETLMGKCQASLSSSPPPLIIGALKSHIGHLEGCSGLAGLIKTILCLQQSRVPPNRHFHQLNPLIEEVLRGSKRSVHFPTNDLKLVPVEVGVPLLAGVSSFGSGGTNVHVIIEARQTVSSQPFNITSKPLQFIAFMFSGQGEFYSGLGQGLLQSQSEFRDSIRLCSTSLPSSFQPTLLDFLENSADSSFVKLLNQELVKDLYQPLAHLAVQIGLSTMWRNQGITPSLVLGHSYGEFAGQ
jgi:acyl transferase domain-containing protein